MRRAAGLLVLACMACGPTLRYRHLKADYNITDRQKTKRIAIVTAPFPDGNAKAAELWSLLTRRLIRLKRQFIVKGSSTSSTDPQTFNPRSACAQGIEGVLWLRPTMTPKDQGYETTAMGTLTRCSDGESIWTARVDSFGASKDPGLTQTIADYVRDVGPEVEPYVAPSEHTLKALVDALPDVSLTETEKDEWIEAGE